MKLNFNVANIGDFDYKVLMSRKLVKDNGLKQIIIDEYTKHDLKKHKIEFVQTKDDWTGDNHYIFHKIRNELLEVGKDLSYIVDVLVEYLYKHKNSDHKTTLWSCFGDIIVENIKRILKMEKFSVSYVERGRR